MGPAGSGRREVPRFAPLIMLLSLRDKISPVRRLRGTPERALSRAGALPCPDGVEVCRGRTHLAQDVQVPVLATCSVPYVENPLRAHRKLLSRPLELLLLVSIAFALPSNQDTVGAEEGGRKLAQGREAPHSSGGNDVVGLAALGACDLLGASVENSRVGDAGSFDRSLHEVALFPHGLD